VEDELSALVSDDLIFSSWLDYYTGRTHWNEDAPPPVHTCVGRLAFSVSLVRSFARVISSPARVLLRRTRPPTRAPRAPHAHAHARGRKTTTTNTTTTNTTTTNNNNNNNLQLLALTPGARAQPRRERRV
jgi:hypothetical protein